MAYRKTKHNILMGYIVSSILVWVVISVFYFRKELFGRQEQEERQAIPEDMLMGIAHDVFQIDEEIAEDNMAMGSVLSEDDFEVEYDSVDFLNDMVTDDDNDDSGSIPEGDIIGFKEMQQMVAVVEADKPLPDIDSSDLSDVKQTIVQIKDTDFFEKMVKTKEDISRRIDDILNNINF
jgi:hypothetical protein